MRAAIGFIAIHAVLVATGFAVLRALGLLPLRLTLGSSGSALGPALLIGVASVIPLLIVLLVIGLPLNLIFAGAVCATCSAVAELVARRRAGSTRSAPPANLVAHPASSSTTLLPRLGIGVAGAYIAAGAFAVARLPTVLDDARIWSLRGLTLTYYHGLQPEVFQNQAQSGGHPIYPLFQPALEALVSQAMGHPQLRFFHVELWLLFASAIWTGVYLIARRAPERSRSEPIWLAPLALLALTPAAIHNIVMGYADITGNVMLAIGALAMALWVERDDAGFLGASAVLLTAAAITKDEDLVAAVLVLALGITAWVLRTRRQAPGTGGRQRLKLLGGVVVYIAVLVVPWRIWVAAHHLTDGVQPPLPRALSPAYFFGRTHELQQAATAMVTQTLTQWGWLAAIFIATSLICVIAPATRRVALFYLTSFIAIFASLLWLYTTTPVSLAFLLPTSTGRTVDLFMALAAVATAHLLALMGAPSLDALREVLLRGRQRRQSAS